MLAVEHDQEPSVVTRHDFREATPRLKHPSHWQRPAPCGAPCLAVLPAVLPSQRRLCTYMRNPSESTNVPRSGPIRRDFEHAMRRLFETKKIVAQPYGAPSKDVSRLVAL